MANSEASRTSPASVTLCILIGLQIVFLPILGCDATQNVSIRHSLSGLSAGGSMVAQHFVAFSSVVDGAAIIAGSPYACGSLPDFDNACNYDEPEIDTEALIKTTAARVKAGLIDPTSTLATLPLYLFAGEKDTVTYPGVMHKANAYFKHYVHRNKLRVLFNMSAEHGYITDGVGECCDCHWGTYILNCHYDQAGDLLQHIYNGELKSPRNWAAYKENVFVLNQRAYAPEGAWWPGLQIHETGWAYVPEACQGRENVQACRIHVHYHGCGQFGMMPAMEIGYNQWAEANRIVVLYPMARAAIGNLGGCWDWWGVTGKDFDTKEGLQLRTVMAILHDLPNAIVWNGRVQNRTKSIVDQ